MVDFIKARLDVAFHCPYWLVRGFASSIDYIDNISDRVLLRPIGPETVTVRIEPRFADWLQDYPDALLNDSVQYRWNTKGRSFPLAFSMYTRLAGMGL